MPIETAADPSFSNIARQANKLMEQMQRQYFTYCPSETWTPSVNLYENHDTYLVCVDLAGVEKEKIEVEVVEQTLKLRGTRQVPMYDEAAAHGAAQEAHAPPAEAPAHPAEGHASPEHRRIRVHLMEIDHGAFCREVELPEDVDRHRINANYRNGILWIELPKK